MVSTTARTYLPQSLIERWRIHQVSLYVGWDGDLRPEHEYRDLDAFYVKLHDSPQLPSTSQPSVGRLRGLLSATARRRTRRALDPHRRRPVRHVRERARSRSTVAEGQQPGRVEVLDGETGAGGLGCLVALAASLAAQGDALDAIVEGVDRSRESLDIWFCLDTLEYLRRGGRIGAAQAMVGTALEDQADPHVRQRRSRPSGRVRTHRRALERMVAYLHELHDRGATDWVVQHAQVAADAERLVAEGTAMFGFGPLFCTQVGPVLGAHLGSGMLVGGMSTPARWIAARGV